MNRIAGGEVEKDVATKETLEEMLPIYVKLMELKDMWLNTMKKYIQANADLKKVDLQEKNANEQFEQKKKVGIQACKCMKCT